MTRRFKFIRETVSQINSVLFDVCERLRNKIGDKYRFGTRVRWLNIWACRHRKKFFIIIFSLMGVILVADISSSIIISKRSNLHDTVQFSDLAEISKIFDQMQTISKNKEIIRSQQNKLIETGNFLVNKLDSLNNLKVKTHEDSVEIVMLYNKLVPINNILKDDIKNQF